MTNQTKLMLGVLIFISTQIQACGIGYNSLLFATKSNVGVDIDTAPPTAEISISRTEGVIEPQFENGKTLPVMAHFSSKVNGLERFMFGVNSAFSTGASAAALSKFYSVKGNKTQDDLNWKGLNLSQKPKRIPWFGDEPEEIPHLEEGLVRPVYFGTHSVFGIKIEWKGTTGQYPSSIKVGYNRSELAWAPISLEKNTDADSSTYPVKVNAPSLLALLNTDSSWGMFNDDSNKLLYTQFFATGEAATELALKEDIRERLIDEFSNKLSLFIKIEGNGKVASNPPGIDCGNDCQEKYSHIGYKVTLTAVPSSGSSFTKWGGHCSGTTTPLVVDMVASKKVYGYV